MSVEVEKIPGGFRVDGLDLKTGKCGCTSIAQCCYTWSKVKKKGASGYEMNAKATDNNTKDHFEWGYTVEKDGMTVKVHVEDARDKEIYSGFLPPAVSAWIERGWTVIEQLADREDGEVYRCAMCRWLYKDKEQGTVFADLPDDWKCPTCSAGKHAFEKI